MIYNPVSDEDVSLTSKNTLGIIDIGSNSVRLVVYEGKVRAPAIVYNEKVMCGLGRHVASTGLLDQEDVSQALKALKRFKKLCDLMKVNEIRIMATAAVRNAQNGQGFIDEINGFWEVPIDIISGEREAFLSTMGVVSGFYQPDGIVGDLGGGSLELSSVFQNKIDTGVSLPLGGLVLQDLSQGSLKEAYKITRKTLKKDAERQISQMEGRSFYAVGGTWRALAKLHQDLVKYPVHFMHGYLIDSDDALKFLKQIEKGHEKIIEMVEDISPERRPLLAYGALVLQELIKRGKPKNIIVSATGVREGVVFDCLDQKVQVVDPLLEAVKRINTRRARCPEHSYELVHWMNQFLNSTKMFHFPNQERMILAACLLSDISWRAHPDYRAEHMLAQVGCAHFLGVDHPSRAYLALTSYCRYAGVNSINNAPEGLRKVAGEKFVFFSRVSSALMRIGYSISVATENVLPNTPLQVSDKEIVLTLPYELEQLANGRLVNRLKQLGKLLDLPTRISLTK